MLKLSATARLLNGTHSGPDREFTSVGTDSRVITPGMLFVALKGDRFDGHDYVTNVLTNGANGALVSSDFAAVHPDLPLVAVADTKLALGKLAAAWRQNFHLPLIGITGSNGKTTVKEMVAAILRADFGQNAVLATTGNLNNDIGLPLTLLKVRSAHRAAAIEMGMNHPGEIAYLTAITRPTVALVNNAQRAHLAGLGTLMDVARAKGEIFGGLAEDGVAVINSDDPHAAFWRELNAGRHVISFGFFKDADVRATRIEKNFGSELELVTPQGNASLFLPVPGEHNARNALAATAACLAAGVPLAAIVRGLSHYAGVKGRLQQKPGRNGARIIDDSYNANPDSMRAAIDVLSALPGRRIFVMGDMGEVGESAGQLHDGIGGYAKSMGLEHLFALGEKSVAAVHNFDGGARHFQSVESLVAALLPMLDPDTTVLVKGSRFMRMERVVESITEQSHAA